jgi:hypothetical protein
VASHGTTARWNAGCSCGAEVDVFSGGVGDRETRVRGTRIWHWLKVIAKNDVRIATDLMLLLMIIDTLLRFFPSQPPPQPAPKLTVNVTVDADEIAEKVAKRLEDEGVCVVPYELSPFAKCQPQSACKSPACSGTQRGVPPRATTTTADR